MRPHRMRRSSLIVLVVATLGLATACGGTPSSAGDELSAPEVAERYGYDADTAERTPVYELVPQFLDPEDGYARDLLARECLRGVIEYRAVPPSLNSALRDERTLEPLFNEQIAAQWGYPTVRSIPATDSAVPDDIEISDAAFDQMIACGEDADARLGRPPERVLNEIESAGWDALETNAQVAEAAAAWRECMAPAGVIDLPEDPHGMPSESVVPRTATYDDQGAQIDSPTVELTDREREVAVLDAQCREQTGYDRAVLRARAEGELAAIGRNLEGFEAARTGYVEYAKGTDAVIAELGG